MMVSKFRLSVFFRDLPFGVKLWEGGGRVGFQEATSTPNVNHFLRIIFMYLP